MDELEEMKILQEINDLRSYLRDAKAKTIPDLETNQGQNTADIDAINGAIAALAEIVGGTAEE